MPASQGGIDRRLLRGSGFSSSHTMGI